VTTSIGGRRLLRRGHISRLIATVVVAFFAVASAAPILYLIYNSLFNAENGVFAGTWIQMFQELPVLRQMANSFIVAAGAALVIVAIGSLAGFGFSKLPFPGSRRIYAVVIALIAVPLATIILPDYFNIAAAGGIGSYGAAVALYAAINLPFATILLSAFFASLPDELLESASLDGATVRQAFLRIMIPLALPAIVIVACLTFLGTWNDLLISLLLLPGEDTRTISVGVSALAGVHQPNVALRLTTSLFSALPPLLLFAIFQRHLISGITAGINR
jgi:ABC-type glycerol-3-phosphate transport system permease component